MKLACTYLVLTLLFCLRMAAQSPLSGKPSMCLDVSVEAAVQRTGLTQDNLRTEIELVLRRNRVPLVSASPCTLLTVVIEGFQNELDKLTLVYRVEVQASDAVIIKRTNVATHAVVWSRSRFGTAGLLRIGTIRDYALEFMNKFCLEYLEQNER
jgi:hypothetical protein